MARFGESDGNNKFFFSFASKCYSLFEDIVVVETSLQNEILRVTLSYFLEKVSNLVFFENNKQKMGNEIQRLHRLTQQQNEYFASLKKSQASSRSEDDAP